jgi:hypothetical protein
MLHRRDEYDPEVSHSFADDRWKHADASSTLRRHQIKYQHGNKYPSLSKSHIELNRRTRVYLKLLHDSKLIRTDLQLLLDLKRKPPEMLSWVPFSYTLKLSDQSMCVFV